MCGVIKKIPCTTHLTTYSVTCLSSHHFDLCSAVHLCEAAALVSVENVLAKPKVILKYVFEQGALEIVALTEVFRHPWDSHKIQQ
jgi:hypothetical protein